MTTTHDTAQTWRDLADQLTPSQIRRITGYEQRWTMPDDELGRVLLDGAREYAKDNLRDRFTFGHLADPAGATTVYPCEEHDGVWFRVFDGTTRRVAGAEVDITGKQTADGTLHRGITVNVDDLRDGGLGADQARELGAALIAAAVELDQLDGA
jgi:hypothetical protein